MMMTLFSSRHLYAAEFWRYYECDRTTLADALGHTDTVSQKFYGDSFDSQEERKFNWSLAIPVGVGVERIGASRSKRIVMSLARLISSLSDKPISDSPLDNLQAYQADPFQITDLHSDHIAERIGTKLTDRANESVASEKLMLS